MKSSNMAMLLLLALSTLPSVLAIDYYMPPNHAVPEMIIIPPNVTIMSHRNKKSQFERQLFDLGSPKRGFSELKRIAERQSCSTGYEACDDGSCCPEGEMCCGDGVCCDSDQWCYNGGCSDQDCCDTGEQCCDDGVCCDSDQWCYNDGCSDQDCCDTGEQCCQDGSCCPSGNDCMIIDGQTSCCPIDPDCTPTCTTTGYSLCPDGTFCCPTGFICYRDSLNNPQCQDPNPPPPSTTIITISVTPPARTYTTTQGVTLTYTPPPRPPTTVISVTSTTSAGTAAALSSSISTTTIHTIAAAAAVGVVVVIVLVIIYIIWRRHIPRLPAVPTTAPITAPLDPTYGGTGVTPPTTPMAQTPNLDLPRVRNWTSRTNSASQYPGLPEIHHSDNAGGMPMPAPRRDLHSPRSLPMSVVHDNSNYASRNNTSGSGSPRPRSGYAPGPPSTVANPGAYMPQPEHSGWSNPASSMNFGRPLYAEGATSSGYAPDRQGQPETTSTTHQPSSHGGYDESLVARSPPASPLPDMYGGMASSSVDPGENGAGMSSSGLSRRTAPPTTYAPGEKQVYRPSQG